MESMDSSTGSQQQPQLPPGFRFHPTDEELVVHYLQKKATSAPLPVVIIAEVDLYKFDPWELPAKAIFGEQEWYFFTPRDRKYPNGARPNRAATSGYWKATGTDKPVLTCGGTQKAGVKKALVFYGGKPPKGIKTNWIMHEYRLADKNKSGMKPPGCDVANKKDSSRLDDWVLCRIYKKNNIQRSMDHESCDSMNDMVLPSILPCLQIGQENLKMETNYGENEENMLERDRDGSSISISLSGSKPQISLPSSNLLSKQNLPTLFWDEVPSSSASSSKRFLLDAARADDNGSIASLLSQLPQNPQLMLGNLGDGGFRNTACELPGMNWYS